MRVVDGGGPTLFYLPPRREDRDPIGRRRVCKREADAPHGGTMQGHTVHDGICKGRRIWSHWGRKPSVKSVH